MISSGDINNFNIKNSVPIFLSSDNNYAPFVATTIASICDNTKSFCEFYVLDGGISQENQNKICELKKQFNNFSVEFIKINTDEALSSIDYKTECPHVTISTYNRFLISKIKPDIEKLIYLDVDIIALDDIDLLFGQDIENYTLGAIPEDFEDKNNNIERIDTLKLDKNHNYFNAGVLLINNKKWVEDNICEKLFETEKRYRNILKWADQDILNIVFNNNYKILDKKFNYMTQEKEAANNIILRHYNTGDKPWRYSPKTKIKINNFEDFWEYAKLTEFYNDILHKCKYKNQLQLRIRNIINSTHSKKENG